MYSHAHGNNLMEIQMVQLERINKQDTFKNNKPIRKLTVLVHQLETNNTF